MEWVRELFLLSGEDAWITVLLACMVALLLGTLVVWAVSLFPNVLPGHLFRTAFGAWLGGCLGLGFVVYTLAEAARASRTASVLIQFAVLPRTPTWILVALPLLVTAVLLRGGIDALLRYVFTLIWPTLALAVAALGVGLRFPDWENFLPVLSDGLAPVLQGMVSMVEPILGLELGLVYLPYFQRKGVTSARALSAVLGGIAGLFALEMYKTVALLGGFGPYETAAMTWPYIEATRRTYLTGLFFERLDLLFLISMLIATTSAVNLYTHAALVTLQQSFSLRARPWQVLLCLMAVWGFGLIPSNLTDMDWWRERLLEPLGLVYLILVPVLLIGAGLVRRWRRSRAFSS